MIVRLAVVAAAGVVLGGCAGGATDAAGAAAARYAAALAGGDGAAVCAALAPAARSQVAQSGNGDCAGAVLREDLPDPGAVQRTEVWGDRALVHLADDTVFLVKAAGSWQVQAAGCRSQDREQGQQPFQCQVSGG